MKKITNASWIVAMFALGVLFGVIFFIGGQAFAAPMGDEMPERIPFTNKPVIAGNPESYIGTYGQCPFYENAMEKGCFPPSDIECNADWSYCQPRTTTVTPPPTQNEPIPASTAKPPQTSQNTANSVHSDMTTTNEIEPVETIKPASTEIVNDKPVRTNNDKGSASANTNENDEMPVAGQMGVFIGAGLLASMAIPSLRERIVQITKRVLRKT